MSFHKLPYDIEDKMLWVSRVSRKHLPCGKVLKNTVLCSRHFHNGKRTAAQLHPLKFEHKTCPLCRKVPLKPSNSEPVSEVEHTAKKVAGCQTVPSLSSLRTASCSQDVSWHFFGTHFSTRTICIYQPPMEG